MLIIGDVHGKMEEYYKLIKDEECSIQIGDMGFEPAYDFLRENVDETKHRFIPGNHDNYHCLPPHHLGHFGTYQYGEYPEIFFVRGALSIDKHYRTQGISWWQEEELTLKQSMECIQMYGDIKPDIVLSHDCPLQVLNIMYDGKNLLRPSFTSRLLEELFDIYPPRLWIFGHHHKTWDTIICGTRFLCLDELRCFRMDKV